MTKVAVGIVVNDGTVLLCQRKSTARYPLKWEFPGGKVEANETPEGCLKRELFEELGISADAAGLYHQQQYSYPDSGAFDVLYYRVIAYSGTIVNNVFESYAWVPLPNLLRYDILEGNRDVVNKLLREHEIVGSENN